MTKAKTSSKGSKTKAEEYRERITKLTARLDRYLEKGFDPEEVAYMGAIKLGYSERNAQLIAMQAPEATVVRGFKAWMDLGRRVRKGESGIQILAPAGRRDAEEPTESNPEGTKARQFFRIAYVFDISQTEVSDGWKCEHTTSPDGCDQPDCPNFPGQQA